MEQEAQGRADDGYGEPLALPEAGDEDAADAAGGGVVDGVDVAVSVRDGDAEGLEEGGAPAYFEVVR